MTSLVGVLWIVGAAFMYAAMNSAAKVAGGYLSIWTIGLARFFFGAMAMLIFAGPWEINLKGTHPVLQIIRGLAAAGAFLLLIQSLKTTPISEVMVLFYSWPAFTALLSAWVLGEPVSGREWLFILAACAGAGVILWPEDLSGGLRWGHLVALTSAAVGSVAIILVRRLGRDNNPFSIYFYLCVVGTLACLGPYLYETLGQGQPYLPKKPVGVWALIIMVPPSILCQLMFNKGFQFLRAPQLGVLMTLELPLAAAFGIIFLGEPLKLKLLLGAGLILFSGVALNLAPKKAK